ncbi:MAG: RNA 2',3'-cyclic phosphodiesterase [Candidatus Thorarchaeota archaeon]
MSTMVRAFLSIDIEDSALISRIAHIQQKLDREAAKMKMVELGNIHFTLRFLGDTSTAKIEQIRKHLQEITFSPFTIRIEGVGAFPSIRRPNVIWIGTTENKNRLRTLKERIDEALGNLSYPIERKFKAHATIARVRAVYNRERMVANLERLQEESIGTMTITAFRMKKSTLTPRGPIYETLWQVPG